VPFTAATLPGRGSRMLRFQKTPTLNLTWRSRSQKSAFLFSMKSGGYSLLREGCAAVNFKALEASSEGYQLKNYALRRRKNSVEYATFKSKNSRGSF
jgi:hypothetical protein